MNGDKEVSFFVVGDIGALVEFEKNVGLAGIDDFDVGYIFLNIAAEEEGDFEGNIFFAGGAARGAVVFAAVASVDDDSFYFGVNIMADEKRRGGCRQGDEKQNADER